MPNGNYSKCLLYDPNALCNTSHVGVCLLWLLARSEQLHLLPPGCQGFSRRGSGHTSLSAPLSAVFSFWEFQFLLGAHLTLSPGVSSLSDLQGAQLAASVSFSQNPLAAPHLPAV